MEWRQQSSVSCANAFIEAQRWIEEVTGKLFGCNDFRAALENGVLLLDLINKLKPGIIKRVNRRCTPIAGLDNVSVFLKACGKLGLNVSQLFDPGDLQDLSTRVTLRHNESKRRLKNVLITIYWLGRKAHLDAFYSGPQLNFKAFEGLLGLALSRALDEGADLKEGWYPEREDEPQPRRSCKSQTSVDSVESLEPRNLQPSSEGCGSDAEAEQVFKMEASQVSPQWSRGRVPPPPPQRKQSQENGQYCTSPLARSKSLSDIPMVYPVGKVPRGHTVYDVGWDHGTAGDWNREEAPCMAVAADSEARWQDDLTKWRNHRWSTKSDHRRKLRDREHVINQMTNGAHANAEKTDAVPLARDQRSPSSSGPSPCASSNSSPSKLSSLDPQPRTGAPPTRSYVTEVILNPAPSARPHSSLFTHRTTAGAMPASDGAILVEESPFASLASEGAALTTPTLEFPFSSQTQVKDRSSPAPPQASSKPAEAGRGPPSQISSLVTTLQPNGSTSALDTEPSESRADPKVQPRFPDDVNQAPDGATDNLHNPTSSGPPVEHAVGQQAGGSRKPFARAGSWAHSASLPRGYRRSEGLCRLSSSITARPFGIRQSKTSSLPRLQHVDDSQGPLSKGDKDGSPSAPVPPSLKRQTASASLKVSPPAPSRQKSETQTDPGGGQQLEAETQPPLQVCSILQDGPGESPPVPSAPCSEPTKLGYSVMRVSLTLKPNSRSDFGVQTHWDSSGARVQLIQPGSPAELCQLRVDDEIVALNGVSVAHMSSSQWMEKLTSSLRAGSLTMDVRRYGNKDWSSGVGGHHSKPGQSRTTLNLTASASALIDCPAHPASHGGPGQKKPVGDASELSGQTGSASGGLELGPAGGARSGAHQLNGGALLPVRVVHGTVAPGEFADNRRTARSEGGSGSAISDLQVPSLSPSASSWMWNYEEERRRQQKWQEEQERLLQEKYQLDQKRLEAEWQRAQQDAVEEEREAGSLNTSEMSRGGEDQLLNGQTSGIRDTATSDPVCDARGTQNGRDDKVWAEECCGFALLSPSHRAQSLSSPTLAGANKQSRGQCPQPVDRSQPSRASPSAPSAVDPGEERKRWGPSVSKVEQERQQILEEMKKRTQLLTDNSWIRQRSSSVHKEPVHVRLRRFESLDNLDVFQQLSAAQNDPRPHSAAAGCSSPRRKPSRYSTGSVSLQTHGPAHPGRYLSRQRPEFSERHHT